MAAVDTVPTFGIAYTLSLTGQSTPWFDPGLDSGIATLTIVFDGSWNGTIAFETTTRAGASLATADPITCSNVNGGSGATSTIGATTTVENWRVDLAGRSFIRAIATITGGTCTVTVNLSRG